MLNTAISVLRVDFCLCLEIRVLRVLRLELSPLPEGGSKAATECA